MSVKIGIATITALIEAVAKAASAVDGVFADGRVDWKDAAEIPALIAAMGDFARISFGDLLPEISDLDADEKAIVAATFARNFDLASDTVEGLIERGFSLLLAAMDALLLLRSLGSRIAKP